MILCKDFVIKVNDLIKKHGDNNNIFSLYLGNRDRFKKEVNKLRPNGGIVVKKNIHHEIALIFPTKKIIEMLNYCDSLNPTDDKVINRYVTYKNLDVIESKGIETVIFSCAGCYDTFKVDYPLYRNYKFRVLHTVEFIDELLEKGQLKLTNEVPLTVTYHDPCHLGRNAERYEEWDGDKVDLMPLVSIYVPPKPKRTGSRGIYDAPRNILKKIPGLKVVEMERIREYSYCCGAGAGVKSAFPDFALKTAINRIQEAEDTGADTLTSACPFCSTNLQDAINESGSKLRFYDISEIILMALGLDTKKSKEKIAEVA